MLHLGRVTDRRSMRPVAAVQPSTKPKKRIASNVAGIDTGNAPGTPCPQCETTGLKDPRKTSSGICPQCTGVGYFGIDPHQPCRHERPRGSLRRPLPRRAAHLQRRGPVARPRRRELSGISGEFANGRHRPRRRRRTLTAGRGLACRQRVGPLRVWNRPSTPRPAVIF